MTTQTEASIAYDQIIEGLSNATPGDGFNPWDWSTSDRSTDDCIRFADGIECIMWRCGRWQVEDDSQD